MGQFVVKTLKTHQFHPDLDENLSNHEYYHWVLCLSHKMLATI